MQTVSTPHIYWGQIAINICHLSMYVRQQVRCVRARIMFLYTWIMSRFTMSHVCIYVIYAWIHVSIYMNHVFLHIQQRIHRVHTRGMFIYKWVMSLLTISNVSIDAYFSEYAECNLEFCAYIHGSNSYVPESCHIYMVYTYDFECISIETNDLGSQKPLVCRSLCKCKETYVSILMLPCMLSIARPFSQRHAHVHQECEHTASKLNCDCYINGLSFCICTTASTPSAS